MFSQHHPNFRLPHRAHQHTKVMIDNVFLFLNCARTLSQGIRIRFLAHTVYFTIGPQVIESLVAMLLHLNFLCWEYSAAFSVTNDENIFFGCITWICPFESRLVSCCARSFSYETTLQNASVSDSNYLSSV